MTTNEICSLFNKIFILNVKYAYMYVDTFIFTYNFIHIIIFMIRKITKKLSFLLNNFSYYFVSIYFCFNLNRNSNKLLYFLNRTFKS